MLNVSKYIGREYDAQNFNCYTLVYEIQKDLGRQLPDIDKIRIDSFAGRASILSEQVYNYEKIDKPVEGCIVAIRYASVATHCGIYIGQGQICHCVEGLGCVISEQDDLSITGFYNVKS